MKRFLLDGILILILVAVGSSVMKQEDPNQLLEQQILEFEQDVTQHKILFPYVEGKSVSSMELNKASALAKNSSEFIETGVRVLVETCASVFKAIVE